MKWANRAPLFGLFALAADAFAQSPPRRDVLDLHQLPLRDAARDAVAHEVQDLCNGRPQRQGQYRYHGPSSCLPDQAGNEILIGHALDGFGIYSLYDANGRELTDADLDDCHGRTSEITWDGAKISLYHYVLTREYPYTVGCFRGTPVPIPAARGDRGPMGARRGPPPGGRMPPFGPPPAEGMQP